ncbi:hypothetical protein [Leptospira mtsangambouensis]|uniref:hypothetical protein n=1 Tax=Leptospira mtsangambouensis TaxID=2484912 RepID=UPI001EEBA088|nr:hypothetical protein [Leptospira mtsangambouensis]MCG6142788.1 hypothetical protein [Leptospira mtsangambouensis]
MNKSIISFLFLINLQILPQNLDFNNVNQIKSFLKKSEWYEFLRLTTNIQATRLVFYENSYIVEDPIEGRPCFEGKNGTFSIQGSQVLFYPSIGSNCHTGFPNKTRCQLNMDSSHPFYSISIECDNGKKFHALNSLKENGRDITAFDLENIEVFRKDFKVKSNLKRRRYPDKNAEQILCINIHDQSIMKFIPKGATFHSFAKTKNKDTIDGVEDFWYFGFPEYDKYPGITVSIESVNWTGIMCGANDPYSQDSSGDLFFNYWVFGGFLN